MIVQASLAALSKDLQTQLTQGIVGPMYHGSHKGISIKYDEQEIYEEDVKPVEIYKRKFYIQVNLHNIIWCGPHWEICYKPKEMELFMNYSNQSFAKVWTKVMELCDGQRLIYMKLGPGKGDYKYVKPGDEIIIKSGLSPY